MKTSWARFTQLFCILLGVYSFSASANEVSIAAASNFAGPLAEISQLFYQKTGTKLAISYGATANIFSQIVNGAPFAVFLSADQEHVKKLVQLNKAIAEREYTYAIGKLVLWSPALKQESLILDALKKGAFKHLSIANPKLAPYGLAAREVLEKMGLWERYQPQIVLGENIAQTFQFVSTGNAELGFVALSQVKQDSKNFGGSFWTIPQPMYSPIKQDAVLLDKGKDVAAAKQFLDFLKSDQARNIIKKYGYDLP